MRKIFFIGCLLSVNVYGFGQVSDTSVIKKDTSSLNNYDMVFTNLEVESDFIGGVKGWIQFLQKHLNSDTPKDNGCPAGKYTVEISFIVDKDGNIYDIKILQDPGYGTAEEVKRIMKLSPKWKPGMQNGIVVKSRKKQRVTFMVTEK